MIKAGIVGGTGYTGVELLRLLALHPGVAVHAVTSRSDAGKRVDAVYPNLRGHIDKVFVEPELNSLSECGVVFFATPNGTAMRMAQALLDKGIKIIDLAADFRLKDGAVWEKWYGEPHACPCLLSEAVYGLPEAQRSAVRNARLLANPGCYPTSVQLALLPLIEAKAIHLDNLVADVKSGASGAGRKAELSLLMSESGESFKAYAVDGHRHLPEIEQELTQAAGMPVGLTFVPHLLPMIRGIHATVYARVKDDTLDFQQLFETRYRDEVFVDVLPAGSHPDTRNVRGSNRCQLAIHRPQQGNALVILSVIDNLVKGAAGQAVQNMNLMFGLPETQGLEAIGLYP
ncbi:N-acetyl-gamma-glutamyl-phosphate reductase [Candidatus Methylospira mobilis]|uniref:N-acetyl-gamma-glutamyl-phosphate reductase n=1 Tax=Candidatus Methylospira mobilis TaxID=1808979 RepID=A0A5Q0BL70_9GAMM|nr:N-acetyl-gamma-glutamyl-phosphate reductase [Candidatus Methylospira mobilis]QFY42516.1 N-acetyl-gamma-glutamyl-phosphate reductase [Candidatus Methylospira mobilis]WNV04377.1 N-acetyl-gamma-glutamyl-phosphate reductase [Candidatus Methylospira mobilis]